MSNKKETAAQKKERLTKLHNYWKGQTRYIKMDEGVRRVFPEYAGQPYYAPDGLTRETCRGINENGEPLWVITPDEPVPSDIAGVAKNMNRAKSGHPAAPTPPFDFEVPAYASDTHSGGPANFDGNMGGSDNPRDPALEGEVPGQYEDAVEAFGAELAANAQ